MLQVVDLLKSEGFREFGVELISISPDPPDAWVRDAGQYGVPDDAILATDAGNQVAEDYDVMQWQAATGEPGHTFVLVDQDGRIAWVRDYGAPSNGGLMYVAPDELVPQIRDALAT